jgi:hypothetical protein
MNNEQESNRLVRLTRRRKKLRWMRHRLKNDPESVRMTGHLRNQINGLSAEIRWISDSIYKLTGEWE